MGGGKCLTVNLELIQDGKFSHPLGQSNARAVILWANPITEWSTQRHPGSAQQLARHMYFKLGFLLTFMALYNKTQIPL